eukprot:TRINITY_DN2063_c0_g1_i1.p1 TRINITY_DN2063_c0_g1~~TRINITY_DN2063_c0_g1_i1.p1  ORF type:complete len:254 (-),score=41.04 TRINITY_DN2063_c0_g1_i1:33-794(-)
MSQFPQSLMPSEDDIAKMLATNVHLGKKNINHQMKNYLWKRRADGFHIINIQKTWEKLMLAARVIVTVENPADVCVVTGRDKAQRAVLKYSKYTNSSALPGRFTPGTFTNQIQDKFIEPRLLVVSDPRIDHQPLKESSYVGIPTIAFVNTDSPIQYVDIAIPCNNEAKQAIGLMWWFLAREVLYLRNTITRGNPWDVMVDLFIHREQNEIEQQQQQQQQQQPEPENFNTEAPETVDQGFPQYETSVNQNEQNY